MRRALGVLVPSAAMVMAVAFSAVPAHAAPAAVVTPAATADDSSAAANFAWVNSQRAAAGVAPLQVQSWAAGVAQSHSIDMANSGTIFHNISGYMSPGHAAMGATYLGENVAVGTSLDYAQSALINSPPHKANILDPRFNFVGIGAATDAAGHVYVTEDFAQIGASGAKPAPPPAPAPAPVRPASPAPVPAPKPAPAPKPVTVHAPVAVVTPRPVVPAPAAVATPSPTPTTPATAAAHVTVPSPAPAKPTATPSLVSHTGRANAGATVLYTALIIVGAAFSLGLGYKLTGFVPGR